MVTSATTSNPVVLLHRVANEESILEVTQSGDLGFRIARTIGIRYPESCKASHINMLRANPPQFLSQPLLWAQHLLTPYTQRDRDGFARSKWFVDEGSGYRILQATKPQTIGYSLADSPVALLAWIYEKVNLQVEKQGISTEY